MRPQNTILTMPSGPQIHLAKAMDGSKTSAHFEVALITFGPICAPFKGRLSKGGAKLCACEGAGLGVGNESKLGSTKTDREGWQK